MLEIETHPYNNPSEIPAGTRAIIVGTAPPPHVDGRDIMFFYGSSRNQLWLKIFGKLYERKFVSPEDMRLFLQTHELWMIDVLQTFVRRKPGSAKDTDLEPRTFTDFRPIFRQHPKMNVVIFTGEKAERWTGMQWEKEQLIGAGKFRMNGKPQMPRHRILEIGIDDSRRKIETFTLPSPSNAANKAIELNKKIEMYGEVLRRYPSVKM